GGSTGRCCLAFLSSDERCRGKAPASRPPGERPRPRAPRRTASRFFQGTRVAYVARRENGRWSLHPRHLSCAISSTTRPTSPPPCVRTELSGVCDHPVGP